MYYKLGSKSAIKLQYFFVTQQKILLIILLNKCFLTNLSLKSIWK